MEQEHFSQINSVIESDLNTMQNKSLIRTFYGSINEEITEANKLSETSEQRPNTSIMQ